MFPLVRLLPVILTVIAHNAFAAPEPAPRQPPIVVVQSSNATSFRGYYVGMRASDIGSVSSRIGFSAEKKGEGYMLLANGRWVGMARIGSEQTVERLILFPAFFELEPNIQFIDFAKKLASSYKIPEMAYQPRIEDTGITWGYAGFTPFGEKVFVSELSDMRMSIVEITKTRSGVF